MLCFPYTHPEVNTYWCNQLPPTLLLNLIEDSSLNWNIKSKVLRLYVTLYLDKNYYLQVLFSHCHVITPSPSTFFEEERMLHQSIIQPNWKKSSGLSTHSEQDILKKLYSICNSFLIIYFEYYK